MVFTLVHWSYDVYPIKGGRTTEDALAELLRSLSPVLSLPVLFLLGQPILSSAFTDLRCGIPSTDLLVVAGVAAAYAYSIVSVVQGMGTTYFEVGCMVLVFVTLGRWFEATAKLGQPTHSMNCSSFCPRP